MGTQKREGTLVIVMLMIAVGFAYAAWQSHLSLQAANGFPTSQVLDASAAKVIGDHPVFLGDPQSPYTLVEWGDFQCPPCRASNRILPGVLQKYKGTVRFEFRNFPLVSIHRYAMNAALVAVQAREQGKFWAMHDELYSGAIGSFGERDINAAERTVHLRIDKQNGGSLKSAQQEVDEDLAEASALGLASTPSFILCCPHGQVVHLRSVEQISAFIKT